MVSDKVMSGVFAINKPSGPSSADIIRRAQEHFRPSQLFAPSLMQLQEAKDSKHSYRHGRASKRWHDRQAVQVKMGHGGTLDPEARGVLILGVGDGTKALASFIGCAKTYECVVLFGADTDSYDAVGRLVRRAPYDHLSRQRVEEALGEFRGKIMQRPPIFSALRHEGKRLYQYAREGKELPVEIKEREMQVDRLELVEWYEGGTHEFQWPKEELPENEKEDMTKVAAVADAATADGAAADSQGAGSGSKRKREVDTIDGSTDIADDTASPKRVRSSTEPVASGALGSTAEEEIKPSANPTASGAIDSEGDQEASRPAEKAVLPTIEVEAAPEQSCPAPACRVRMTVSSGFYVRSFCHDLGVALDSAALMANLVRSRQGDFELGKNVLEYEELAKGEEVWAPQIEKMLDEWNEKSGHQTAAESHRSGNKGARSGGKGHRGRSNGHRADDRPQRAPRRNTSSPEA